MRPTRQSVADEGVRPAELVADAAALGVVLTSAQAGALLEYRDLLLRWNRAFNLVSRRDTPRLVPRHLLDSLTVAPWLSGGQVLDLGTGAGLPGLPLAIAREDAHFTLIDLSERKIRFIGQVVRSLGLANVTPLCTDVRDLPDDAAFDSVVCRAVSDAATVWSLAAPRLTASGRLVLMSRAGAPAPVTANREPAAMEDDAGLPDDARLEARQQVRLPGLERPHELIILRRAEHAGSTP